MVLAILICGGGCFDPAQRQGRVNPFDVNGDNWFPPSVDIVDDTVFVTGTDSAFIQVRVSDRNGTVSFLRWVFNDPSMNRVDTIALFEDSMRIEHHDTVFTDSVDTIVTTSAPIPFDSTTDPVFDAHVNQDHWIITIHDSLDSDTIHFKSGADSTYEFIRKYSEFFQDTTNYINLIVTTRATKRIPEFITVLDSVFYLHTSLFLCPSPGIYPVSVTAIDNDNVESIFTDSSVILVE